MSIQRAIAGYIAHAGKPCTVDDLRAAFPGFTPKQVENAINCVRQVGWIKSLGKQGKKATYGPGSLESCGEQQDVPTRTGGAPAVAASVWELAQFGWPAVRRAQRDFAKAEAEQA
jgi:hypothetical protein